jgi:hypothetical protein
MIGRTIPIVLACLVSLWSTLLLSNAHRAMPPSGRPDWALATDGAYRDGLYIGRLVAERGLPPRPPTGRWSKGEDRKSFAAGYWLAYNEYRRHKPTTSLTIHDTRISQKKFLR